jgi:hypothetical protein
VWFIEFDVKGCFDNIAHHTLVKILEKKIDDVKFLQIIRRMLSAGYMENWKFHRTYSGAPQGSIVSPILANIYLHELDEFVNCLDYQRGKKRSQTSAYRHIVYQKNRLRKQIKGMVSEGANAQSIDSVHKELDELGKVQRSIPRNDPVDPDFRRLWYCRYADDFLIGLIGPKQEAEAIKNKVETFLTNELHLELSAEKTGIKHAKTEGTTFLGYHIRIATSERVLKLKSHGSYALTRTMKGKIQLSVPEEKIKKFCTSRGYGQWAELRSTHRSNLMELSDAEIISTYNAVLRGIANYYALARDVKSKLRKLFYIAHSSMVKTLAAKHKTNCSAIFSRLNHRGRLSLRCEIKGKTRVLTVFKLTDLKVNLRRYGSIDQMPRAKYYNGSELLQKWNAQECEICGRAEGYFEIHHIKRVADIKDGKQNWQKRMKARNRKTLVLCVECHTLLHTGKLPDWRFKDNRMESRVR